MKKYFTLFLTACLLLPSNYAQAEGFDGTLLACGELGEELSTSSTNSTWLIDLQSSEAAVVWRFKYSSLNKDIYKELGIYIRNANVTSRKANVSSTDFLISIKEQYRDDYSWDKEIDVDRRTLKSTITHYPINRDKIYYWATCRIVDEEEFKAVLKTWRTFSSNLSDNDQMKIEKAREKLRNDISKNKI